jgi:anti-sigma B factor antagonist
MAVPSRIQVSDIDGIMVVRFTDHQLFDERPVREIAEQIAINLPSDGPIRLILDFSDVGLLSSIALGKFILIQRRVDSSRGGLRLCELSPVLQQVFRTANLDRLFTIDRDLRTSLEAMRKASPTPVKPAP